MQSHVATGAMGQIYRVVHHRRGTHHALKYLPLASTRIKKRLIREARLQTRLSHPNVVTLTEVLEIGGDPALVMEFVDGPALSEWMQGRLLQPLEAEQLFVGIVQGVAHAHRKDLVHRDLKPSNVLLARTPEGLVPKVADFGIAKAATPSGDERLTFSGSSLGSPAYMAPEQIQDAHLVDKRADVFSLGCLLYEMVCGERAFTGRDTLAVLNAVASGGYRPPREVVPELPDYLVEIIDGCLDVNRERRLQSCDAILAVIEEAHDDSHLREEALRLSEGVTVPQAPPRDAVPTATPIPRRRETTLRRVSREFVVYLVILLAALLLGVFGAWLVLG